MSYSLTIGFQGRTSSIQTGVCWSASKSIFVSLVSFIVFIAIMRVHP